MAFFPNLSITVFFIFKKSSKTISTAYNLELKLNRYFYIKVINMDPIVSKRNYAPTRTFVSKWDIEINHNRNKKISRNRDRDTKYVDYFDRDDGDEPLMDMNDEDSDSNSKWLQSIHAENEYYDKKYHFS